MGRKKLLRFNHNHLAVNVLEPEKRGYKTVKGKWNEVVFSAKNPIVLELACGKGEYSVGLAEIFKNKNFIGIDVKGDRIAVGSELAIVNNLTNVAFLRTNIYFIEDFFEENEIAEIWITFPDPFNKKKRSNRRRLTHESYLEKYAKLLKEGGVLHLKTDNRELFEFTIAELITFGVNHLEYTYDLYKSHLQSEHYGIKTKFEKVFTQKGFDVHYLRCSF